MNYFGMSYDQVIRELPYSILVMLSSSVPKYKPKSDEEKKDSNNGQGGGHLFHMLGGSKIPDPK